VHIKNEKDLVCGVLFAALGIAFAWTASRYSLGHAERLGPGFFPLLLGALLTVLGALLVFKALVFETEDGGRIGPWGWRPMAAVLLATLAFGALLGGLPHFGLAPAGLLLAVPALVLLAHAAIPMAWQESLLLAALLGLASYLVFCALLGMPLRLWPAAWGG